MAQTYLAFIQCDYLGILLTRRYTPYVGLGVFTRKETLIGQSSKTHESSMDFDISAVIVDLDFLTPPRDLSKNPAAQKRWRSQELTIHGMAERSLHTAVDTGRRRRGGLAMVVGLGRLCNVSQKFACW